MKIKKLVPARPTLRANNRPILEEHQCQKSQTDPLPACPSHVGHTHLITERIKPSTNP